MFVCTGNICRSPIAERLTAAYVAQLGIPSFRASSAGIRAVVGYPIQQDAAGVLNELGVDSTNFAARQLTVDVASDADLVLTMTRAHRDAVMELVPRQVSRTFTLSEAAALVSTLGAQSVAELAALRPRLPADAIADVADPIGHSAGFHATVGAQIATLLPPIYELCRAVS